VTKRIPHPSEELLEEYFFHRLGEARLAEVEEHLLICEVCRNAVQELDLFIPSMKAEAARPARSQPRNMSVANRIGVASTVALLLIALVVFRTRPFDNPTPAEVILSSIRGGDLLSEAPSGKPLQLNIEAPDLVSGQAYRVAVVDAAGESVWTGKATDDGGKILAQIPKRLMSGMYWVRLYDANERQLREFGMSVK
jgi:Putative zinc-finger